ncbi:hypothetical protein [Rickettsia endosymbiont of Gonocerus acuteangulatus]|uniref:hypothetical protein n=1 Tax=Rickettsia endosymbiont of Gonocerus acuteangulatus TaxID=3066266 RepID=UPI003132D661
MPNPLDNIRQNAFKYVMENKPSELFELIAMNPGLINERSRGNQDTLFMRACKYLHKDIIEILIKVIPAASSGVF